MTRKIRALLLAMGMMFTPILATVGLTTIGIVQQATPASAYTNPNYWNCQQYWDYDYTYFDGNGFVDVYDVYNVCTSQDGGSYSYYVGQRYVYE